MRKRTCGLFVVAMALGSCRADPAKVDACLAGIKSYGEVLARDRPQLKPFTMPTLFEHVAKANGKDVTYSTYVAGPKEGFDACEQVGLGSGTVKTVESLATERTEVVLDSLPQCRAAMTILGAKVEALLGSDARAKGSELGTELGDAHVVISHALGMPELTRDMVAQEATKRLFASSGSFSQVPEWLTSCDRIGVALRPVAQRLGPLQ